MNLSTVITAAIPLPVTAFQLIPTYRFQTGPFSVYVSLYCFLLLGYIMYIRHDIAKFMFLYYYEVIDPTRRAIRDVLPMHQHVENTDYLEKLTRSRTHWLRITPVILIIISLMSVIAYHETLRLSVSLYFPSYHLDEALLANESLLPFPYPTLLFLEYLLIFMSAESAFIVMAIKEWFQAVLELDEVVLLRTGSLVEAMPTALHEAIHERWELGRSDAERSEAIYKRQERQKHKASKFSQSNRQEQAGWTPAPPDDASQLDDPGS